MIMRASVADYIYQFNAAFEGVVPWMYLDTKGLVTVANGNLIDPIGLARGLEMRHVSTGQLATQSEVDAEWRAVKANVAGAKNGHRWIRKFTRLEMSSEGMEALARKAAESFASACRVQFAEWDSWPADAQLATLSLCYALGPGQLFRVFRSFVNAAKNQDWKSCMVHGQIKPVPGIVERNVAMQICFSNADRVKRELCDAEVLHYPAHVGDLPLHAKPKDVASHNKKRGSS
jgi:GH24 family phage-related lysozyme (muramidase)